MLARLFDPAVPDSSIRDFWHVGGVIVDSYGADGSTKIQRRPAGVLYVYNCKLIYQSRHCSCSRNDKPLEIEISDIHDVNHYNKFTSHKDGKTYSGNVIDVVVTGANTNTLHVGFLSSRAEEMTGQLKEICTKHRLKPRIYQFNSVDVDGVEIDLP
ncbi:hypothetical protein AAVH_00062 [Aphelenchoides avenae]|nr:hypothetical protein AAVH_00062 [Aphelenchus avenae]